MLHFDLLQHVTCLTHFVDIDVLVRDTLLIEKLLHVQYGQCVVPIATTSAEATSSSRGEAIRSLSLFSHPGIIVSSTVSPGTIVASTVSPGTINLYSE